MAETPQRRRLWLAGALVLVAIAGLLAAFAPWDRSDAGRAAPGLPDGVGSPSASGLAPDPAATSPGPAVPSAKPATTRPAAADPESPTRPATRKPTTAPTTTPDDPPTTTRPPQPQTRTLESAGGSVRATCPEPSVSQLLSWTAKDPYVVRAIVPGPRAKTGVQFRNGKDRIRMVVTCTDGVPSAVTRNT